MYSPSRELYYEDKIALYVLFKKRNNNPKGERKAELLLTDPFINAIQAKFGHAITCHKAQGSEWKHVLINVMDSKLSEKYYRWLYTAVTRSTKQIFY